MIYEQQDGPNEEEVESQMTKKLQELHQKYELKQSWVTQFINQNLYLSDQEIIKFADSCKEITLQTGQKILPKSNTKHDYIYCLLQGKAKIMKYPCTDNIWELKRNKLTALHNYKVWRSDDSYCIVADSDCTILRFDLPFTRQQYVILSNKRSFLCQFFNVDFNSFNFDVLDLFKFTKYIVGEKISNFKNKLCIVKEGACNYSFCNELEREKSKIGLIDRSGPFILNYQNFVGVQTIINCRHQIRVKEAQIVCLQASVHRLIAKNFFKGKVIKSLKQKCQEEHLWLCKLIQKKKFQLQSPLKTVRKINTQSLKSRTLSQLRIPETSKKLFESDEQQLNVLTKTVHKSRLTNREKRVSFEMDLQMKTYIPIKNDSDQFANNNFSVDPKRQYKQQPSKRSQSSIIRKHIDEKTILNTKRLLSKKVNLQFLNDYQTAVNNKRKILNYKLKPYGFQNLFLYQESPNASTKSFKLRMIQSGQTTIQVEKIKHTDSSKKVSDLKSKYTQKIEQSNRIGVQGMIIHSNSQQQFLPLQRQFLDSQRNSISTRRLSHAEYHNYLVYGDTDNPKQEPLQKVHRNTKMLRSSSSNTYNHSQHLKKRSKLFRYSSNKMRSPKKPSS